MEIPEGHWGIYKDKENMPLERFDPFRTIINEFGTKVGHITQFSPLRGNRPFEHKESEEDRERVTSPPTDSFCKIINGDLPALHMRCIQCGVEGLWMTPIDASLPD